MPPEVVTRPRAERKRATGGLSASSPKYLGTNRIHALDARKGLKRVKPASVDVAVTSPPYWGQRESAGIGTEDDPRDYINALVEILDLTMQTLKPTGLLWLNMGDAYNTPVNWRLDDRRYSTLGPDKNGHKDHNAAYTKKRAKRRAFIDKETGWLQYGNLLGLPYRVVIALSDLGYLFRGEVIWEKSRPMPEGRCRRPHRRHESIYLFARDERHAFEVSPPVGSVWDLVQTPNRTSHCSPFPLDLPLKAIKSSNVKGRGIILDPFMGSGTTAFAAQLSGHDFIGFEIDKQRCAEGMSVLSAAEALSPEDRASLGQVSGRRSADRT
jgi:DNA modification methylase